MAFIHPLQGAAALAVCLLAVAPLHAADSKPRPPAECRAQLNVAGQDGARLAVRVRPTCPVTREQLMAALAEVRGNAFSGDARPVELRVDLGRIAEHPWLSAALAHAALNSREWDRNQGKPRARNLNQFAGVLLRVSGALDGLVPGWTLQGAFTEKVLVQPARNMPTLGLPAGDRSLVPWDGQLWLLYVPAAGRAEAPGPAPTVIPPARLDE